MKNKALKYSFLALTLFLTGCASYHSQPLAQLTLETPESSKEEIVALAKSYDRSECKRYLDRDVLAEGYQPVQLLIQNNTNKNYSFALSRLSVPSARPEVVAQTVHTSTVGRAVGYGVGALFLWPLAIPAVVDGIGSAKANDNLDSDFSSKAAHDQTIAAHSTMNKIIFVPRAQYESNFEVTLLDLTNNEPKTLKLSAN